MRSNGDPSQGCPKNLGHEQEEKVLQTPGSNHQAKTCCQHSPPINEGISWGARAKYHKKKRWLQHIETSTIQTKKSTGKKHIKQFSSCPKKRKNSKKKKTLPFSHQSARHPEKIGHHRKRGQRTPIKSGFGRAKREANPAISQKKEVTQANTQEKARSFGGLALKTSVKKKNIYQRAWVAKPKIRPAARLTIMTPEGDKTCQRGTSA